MKGEGDAMTDSRRSRFFVGALALLLVLMISAGCASLKSGTASSEDSAVQITTEEEETPGPLYYDFGDVLVPVELKPDRKRSFIYHAPGFTAGVLVLTGRVDLDSLVRFFENNMVKDNWRLLSAFKSPRAIMFFSKANRSCVVNITEKQFKTEVEIWVAPTVDDSEATLLK